MIVFGIPPPGLLRMISGNNVIFYSYNRLYTLTFAGFVKIDSAVHSAVVGNGHSRHAELFDAGNQPFYLGQSIQKRIFRMDMEVDEDRKSTRLNSSHSQI